VRRRTIGTFVIDPRSVPMSAFLSRLGRYAARRPWRVVAAWAIVAVAVVAGSAAFGRELDDDTSVPGLDSQRAVDLLAEAGSGDGGVTAQVVVTPLDPGATFEGDAASAAALESVRADLAALPNVVGVAEAERSPDGRVALVRVQYPPLEVLEPVDLDRLKTVVADGADGDVVQVEAGGELFFDFEQPETNIGELIGLLVAVAVLLIAFGSVVAAGLPLGTALLGLAIGVSSLGLVTYVVEVPSFSTVIASMVGLGAGIDYALFVVTRHREQLAAGVPMDVSIARAIATAGRAVVFAGGTVVVSILGLAVAGLPFMTASAVAISLVVLVMVAAAITLLPAFLAIVGARIDRWHIGRRHHEDRTARRWATWGRHVTRHPVPYAISATALLLALAAPVLALRLGVPDEGTLPESRTERRAYDLVAEAFGPGSNGPLLVAVDLGDDPAVATTLADAVAADPGIAAVQPADVDAEAGVAVIVAIPTTAPQDVATRATVERLRSEVFPSVLGGTGATAHVGGQTANFADLSDRVQQRLPWFVLTVVVVSFLLLMLVFRSILVPLKAALLNLLSIGGAYGVLVMVFQWEWAGSLIGLEAAVPIVSFIPLMMFAIVFGLSMDYEVFLLSRVREHYDLTGDNDTAVIHGLASTARVITSAALIMVSVFLGFVAGDDPTIKMLGLGLATAIFVDATIVRMVLVPAFMALMGDANWWLPRPLARVLPSLDIDGVRDLSGTSPLAPDPAVAR
jgi:putative drug exporter of the RND superfamily